mgnify:CR=1 FL=1
MLTTGAASGALARTMGKPKAEIIITDVMNMAISLHGFVLVSPLSLLESMVGKGARR